MYSIRQFSYLQLWVGFCHGFNFLLKFDIENCLYCKCQDEQINFLNPQDDMIEKTTYPSNISNDISNDTISS